MKQKYTYLAIVAILLIIFAFIKYIYEPKVYSNETISKFIDIKGLNKIEILNNNIEKIVIEKKDNLWFMTQPYNWQCEQNDIKQFISKLETSKLYGPLSENKNNHYKFEINEKSPIVIIYSGTKNFSFTIGKEASSFNSIFIKPFDKDFIYELNGIASFDIRKPPIEFLNKSVININENEIEKIKILYQSKEFNLFKKDNLWDSDKSKNIYDKLKSLRFSEIQKINQSTSAKPEIIITTISKSSTLIAKIHKEKSKYNIEINDLILKLDEYDSKKINELKELLK